MIDAPQLVLGRNSAFGEFAKPRLDLAQFLAGFRLRRLLHIDDLQLRLGDLALRPGLLREQRAPFALQPRDVALGRQ